MAPPCCPHSLLAILRVDTSHLIMRMMSLLAGYVTGVANDKFEPTKEDPGFALVGGMKDVGHMQRLGAESGAPLPIADVMMQHLQQVTYCAPPLHNLATL